MTFKIALPPDFATLTPVLTPLLIASGPFAKEAIKFYTGQL